MLSSYVEYSALPRFGEWLREQRIAARLTQDELAERVGVSKAYISNIERDQPHPRSGALPEPSPKVMKGIAGALSIPIDKVISIAYESARNASPSSTPAKEDRLDYGNRSPADDEIIYLFNDDQLSPEARKRLKERIRLEHRLELEREAAERRKRGEG